MKTRIVFSVLLLLFFFSACLKIKDDTYQTIVKGRVINYGSKKPIDSVLVGMKDGVYGDKYTSTYTDKDGYFTIELKGSHSAWLGLEKRYYTYEYIEEGGGSVIGIRPFSDGIHENVVLEMKAHTRFEPILKSKELSYATDTIFFETLTKHLSDWEIIRGLQYRSDCSYAYYGKGPFKPYDYGGIGTDKYKIYRITLTSQGVTTVKIDSVYIEPFEHYGDTIYY